MKKVEIINRISGAIMALVAIIPGYVQTIRLIVETICYDGWNPINFIINALLICVPMIVKIIIIYYIQKQVESVILKNEDEEA